MSSCRFCLEGSFFVGEGARRGARGAGERVGRLVPRVVGYRKG